jgi:hypothetical protein
MAQLESTDPGALGVLSQAMVGQEAAGVLASLLVRLTRWLGGDPAGYISVTGITTGAAVGLPDLPGVQSAVLYVGGGGVNLRMDGGIPVSGVDLAVVAGSLIVLTGVPTIKGLLAVAASGTASLTGCYFT